MNRFNRKKMPEPASAADRLKPAAVQHVSTLAILNFKKKELI